MKKYRLIDKLKYHLDTEMSKGTISIIMLLSGAVVFVVCLATVLILLFKLRDGVFSAFWDSLATIVNAWMPSSDDGTIGYVILNTITAVVGLLFTSILIGVISSGIEEKLETLRKGNSIVLEDGHTVILGYNFGEHGLLNQLILSAEKERKCIVILTDLEKPELEEELRNNVEIPKNVKVICRHGDITNVNDLRCCSIQNAEVIIVNALDDNRRIKAILAVSKLKKEFSSFDARLISCVTDEKHLLPRNKTLNKKMTIMKTDDFMAKVIAHTSTGPGISTAFKELLNFEDNELYFEKDQRLSGKTVLEATSCLDKATLAGIIRNGKLVLNPAEGTVLNEDDTMILFERSKGSYRINEVNLKNVGSRNYTIEKPKDKGRLTVFGYNKILPTIIDELNSDIKTIRLVNEKNTESDSIISRNPQFEFRMDAFDNDRELEKIAKDSDHIIILSDREMDKDDADTDNIILLLKLMDIKERYDCRYNIVAELRTENSYNVAPKNSGIDYVVGSNIASLILAQMTGDPRLEEVFDELLSKKGNELYSKPIESFNINTEHDFSFNALKQIALSYKYTLFGYIHNDETVLNPDSSQRIQLKEGDRLIVLGKD